MKTINRLLERERDRESDSDCLGGAKLGPIATAEAAIQITNVELSLGQQLCLRRLQLSKMICEVLPSSRETHSEGSKQPLSQGCNLLRPRIKILLLLDPYGYIVLKTKRIPQEMTE